MRLDSSDVIEFFVDEEDGIPVFEKHKKREFTCYLCRYEFECDYSYNLFNLNGRCKDNI